VRLVAEVRTSRYPLLQQQYFLTGEQPNSGLDARSSIASRPPADAPSNEKLMGYVEIRLSDARGLSAQIVWEISRPAMAAFSSSNAWPLQYRPASQLPKRNGALSRFHAAAITLVGAALRYWSRSRCAGLLDRIPPWARNHLKLLFEAAA
jgi:hypothetical protein